MSKRIKKVFSSNSQVCHVWAQQTQSEGRSSSVFFEGNKIYSYGYHYLMAQIHEKNGKKFALVNSKGYSNTTTQHTNHVYDALRGLMPVFESPNPSSISESAKHLNNSAKNYLESVFKKVKITSKGHINLVMEKVRDNYRDSNQFQRLLGRKEIGYSLKRYNEAKKYLEARLARYHELNTPEMIAKKEAKRLKEVAKREEIERQGLQQAIEAFRHGGPSASGKLYRLSFELLRINGGKVQTSRGAEVPLKQAKLLYRALVSNRSVKGAKVGEFTVISVTPLPNGDKAVKIGCHNILLSEAQNVLG